MLMNFEMLYQLIDPAGQYGNLHLRRAGIRFVRLVLLDDGLFLILA